MANWGTDLWDSMSTMAGDAEQQWQNAVENLKARAQEFVQVENRLIELAPVVKANPELQASYDKLMGKGKWIKESISTITSMIDKGSSTLNGVGVQTQQMGQLGFLPLIPIAMVLGASAGATAWIFDANVEARRIELAEKLAKTPGEAAQILSAGKGFFNSGSTFQTAGIYLLIGGGLYFMWPKIKGLLNAKA